MRTRSSRVANKPDSSEASDRAARAGSTYVEQVAKPDGPSSSLLNIQRSHGNRIVQRALWSLLIQAKLDVSRPEDRAEQEADRVADAVMRSGADLGERVGVTDESTRLAQASSLGPEVDRPHEQDELHDEVAATRMVAEEGQEGEVGAALEARIKYLSGVGKPLDELTRAFFEPRFGYDFSAVRVHSDSRAAEISRSLHARAFTVGTDIAFGAEGYSPETPEGRRLLAHELTHVIQQGSGVATKVQRAGLETYNDHDPAHDPSKLTNEQIQATDEYAAFIAFVRPPSTQRYATAAEALLACRLLLRVMREGGPYLPYSPQGLAQEFLTRAKRQLGVLTSAQTQVGNLNWTPFNTTAAVNNPSQLPTEFGRWVLAGGPEPDALSGSINCWEMVLFGAYRGGFITFARIQQIYNLAVANVRARTAQSVGDTVETELRRGNQNTFDPTNADSPEPLSGDIVIFQRAAVHVAISLGTKNASGEHEVLSLWSQPNNNSHVQRTTIEALLAVVGNRGKPVKFWGAKW